LALNVTDFLVERPNGSVRLGVKGVTAFAHASWLSDKLDAITRAYAQKGLLFESVTDMDLYRQPLAESVDAIWRARRVRVEAEARDQVLSALACGPLPRPLHPKKHRLKNRFSLAFSNGESG